MADEVHQDDPTMNMSLDQKIQPNTQTAPPTFDISQPVVPGHDMVVNHLDGTQELATGNEANAIAKAEAEKGENVPLSEVQPQPEESTHRSVPDPETNQPNPAVGRQLPETGDPVSAPAEQEPVDDVTPEEVEDEPETPKEETPEDSEEKSEPTSEDVDGV